MGILLDYIYIFKKKASLRMYLKQSITIIIDIFISQINDVIDNKNSHLIILG